MLRRLRTAFLVVAGLFILAFGTLVVLANVYDAEAKVKLVGALNQRLNAPVTVSDMDLTLIARFPEASIRLSDVLAREVRHDGGGPDTLLHARELFLEFSLWDLFQGRYTLKGIHGSEVRLYASIDQEGRDNYTIWKSDSTAASSPIELERVSVDGALVRYRDARSALAITVAAGELALRGRFTEEESRMTLTGDLHLRNWQQERRTVLQDRQATLNVALAFGGADGGFHITKGELLSNNVPLEVTLDLVPGPKGDELDLKAKGLGVDLGDDAVHVDVVLRAGVLDGGEQGAYAVDRGQQRGDRGRGDRLDAIAQFGQQRLPRVRERLQPGERQEATGSLDRVDRPEDAGDQIARVRFLLEFD